jgi:hypothetical protein
MLNLIRQNRFDEAISGGGKRINANDQDYRARYALGVPYFEIGHLQKNYPLKKVTKKRIDDYNCHTNLGVGERQFANESFLDLNSKEMIAFLGLEWE